MPNLFNSGSQANDYFVFFGFGTPALIKLRVAIWRAAVTEAANALQSFIFTFYPRTQHSSPALRWHDGICFDHQRFEEIKPHLLDAVAEGIVVTL